MDLILTVAIISVTNKFQMKNCGTDRPVSVMADDILYHTLFKKGRLSHRGQSYIVSGIC